MSSECIQIRNSTPDAPAGSALAGVNLVKINYSCEPIKANGPIVNYDIVNVVKIIMQLSSFTTYIKNIICISDIIIFQTFVLFFAFIIDVVIFQAIHGTILNEFMCISDM